MVGRRYIRYIHTESHHVDFLTGVLTFRTALNTRYLFLLLFFTDARWHINRFILQLGLTKDINEFMDKVINSPLAGNVDSPESGKSYNFAGCRYLKSEEVLLLSQAWTRSCRSLAVSSTSGGDRMCAGSYL